MNSHELCNQYIVTRYMFIDRKDNQYPDMRRPVFILFGFQE